MAEEDQPKTFFADRQWPETTQTLRQFGGIHCLAPLANLVQLGDLALIGVRRLALADGKVSPAVLAMLSDEDLVWWDELLESGISETGALSTIASLDLSPIQDLRGLIRLDLSESAVCNIAPLAGLQKLYRLSLEGTQVSDVGPLSKLRYLQKLYLSDTQVRNVGPLQELGALKWLFLRNTPVVDIEPLAKLQSLVVLDLAVTKVTDFRPLATLQNLEVLGLTRSMVSDAQMTELMALPVKLKFSG